MKINQIPTPSISIILKEEFLEPLCTTPYRLAKELHVSTSTILDILHDKRKNFYPMERTNLIPSSIFIKFLGFNFETFFSNLSLSIVTI